MIPEIKSIRVNVSIKSYFSADLISLLSQSLFFESSIAFWCFISRIRLYITKDTKVTIVANIAKRIIGYNILYLQIVDKVIIQHIFTFINIGRNEEKLNERSQVYD